MSLKEHMEAYKVSLRRLSELTGLCYWSILRHARNGDGSVDFEGLETYLKQRGVNLAGLDWSSTVWHPKPHRPDLATGDRFTVKTYPGSVFQVIDAAETHFTIKDLTLPGSRPHKWSVTTMYCRGPKKFDGEIKTRTVEHRKIKPQSATSKERYRLDKVARARYNAQQRSYYYIRQGRPVPEDLEIPPKRVYPAPEEFKKARLKSLMSIEEAAKTAGVAARTICSLESGEHKPSIATYAAINNAYGHWEEDIK